MRIYECLTLALLIAPALAFPSFDHVNQHYPRQLGILSGLFNGTSQTLQSIGKDIQDALSALNPTDALTTPVDVSGVHAFHPPVTGDQRGPCPGLNALANHGYISRNGVASLPETVAAINQVYGMGVDLALVLTIMGVVWTGDPISLDPSFSIGKNDSAAWNVLENLLGVLGTPEGIDYSHNFIESDSSPTRNDLFVTGNAWTMNLSNFEGLYNTVPRGGNFDLNVLSAWGSKRFNDSVQTNPYFYYGPFTGMIARNAGYCFITRLFANYSSAHPDGVLTHDTLKSFFAVSGDGSSMKYLEGWERIPDNWYKNPVDYGLIGLNLDVVDIILQYPELGSIGGNVGTVNSFTGVDMDNILGGVLNAAQLLESNNLLCFILEVVKLASPNYLNNLYSTLSGPLDLLFDILDVPLASLGCPVWTDLTMGGKPLWEALEDKYPGANKSSRAL